MNLNKEDILKRFQKIEDKLLISKVIDKAVKMQKARTVTYTDFLDPYQSSIIEKAFSGFKDIDMEFDGGFYGAERVVIFFRPCFMSFEEDEYHKPFRLVDISFSSGGILTHRDYLGSLMGLGIKREKIGDILVRENGASIVVLGDIAEYISINLAKIGNIKVGVRLMGMEDLTAEEPESKTVKATAASLRLDVIAAAGFGMSRSKISQLIKGDKVYVNWVPSSDLSREIKQGDTISVRGKGRIILEEAGKTTKKGRTCIVIKKLI